MAFGLLLCCSRFGERSLCCGAVLVRFAERLPRLLGCGKPGLHVLQLCAQRFALCKTRLKFTRRRPRLVEFALQRRSAVFGKPLRLVCFVECRLRLPLCLVATLARIGQ